MWHRLTLRVAGQVNPIAFCIWAIFSKSQPAQNNCFIKFCQILLSDRNEIWYSLVFYCAQYFLRISNDLDHFITKIW